MAYSIVKCALYAGPQENVFCFFSNIDGNNMEHCQIGKRLIDNKPTEAFNLMIFVPP